MNVLKTSLLATTVALALGVTAVNAHPPEAETPRTVGQTIDDATITASVKSKLLADERTQGFDINVDTERGTVKLTGGADSLDAKLAAGKLAAEAEGVILVDNQLIVAGEGTALRQEANTATASGEVRDALDGTGETIDDAWITSKVKAQLLADTAVKGMEIKVETEANVVTLSGTAESAAARDLAIKIATDTKGVNKVIASQLVVKP